MKSITLITSLLIAGIAVGEEKQQPLTIGRILPKATSTEVSKEKPTLKIGKLVPSDQEKPKIEPERPRFPKHWGHPPKIQTRDMVKLPADFGRGSSTLAHWIKDNLKRDAKNTDKEEGKKKPEPKKPEIGQPDKPDPVEEYRRVEKWLEGHKAEAAKLERDLQVKIAEANKNPDKREVEIHVKNLVAEHDAKMAGHAGERKNLEDRLAELKKLPEVIRDRTFPPRPEPPTDVKEKMDSYAETQRELQAGLRSALQALGKKPSPEEVRKTLEKFRAENKDTIEAQKELGKSIQEWQKENRPERPKRPEPSKEVKAKLATVRLVKNDLDIARKALGQELRGKSKEDSTELIKAFKNAQKERHQELKVAKQDLQKLIREAKQDGDRRK